MTSITDLRQRTDDLRHSMTSDPYGAVAKLVDLADEVSSDRSVYFRALLLKRQLVRPSLGPNSDPIADANAILDAIVADFQAQAERRRPPAAERLELVARMSKQHELPEPTDAALSLSNVTKTYGSGFALGPVDFELKLGQITGVMGRNGNGKTTLFRLVVGELQPTTGTIRYPAIEARHRSWRSIRRRIAYVPQDLPRWYGSLRSNLSYEAAIHGVLGRDNDREVNFIVERLGLAGELDKRWSELSGGFKLRFSLARALVQRPQLLVLDEPLANLDFETQEVVLKDIRQLARSRRRPLAVLVSSQHVHEIEEVANSILFIHDGKASFYEIGQIGETRDSNTFEVGGNFDILQLQSAVAEDGVISIHHSGLAFVISAKREVTAQGLLQKLINAELPLDYFRDISKSTKSLFQETRTSGELRMLAAS